MKCLVVDDDPLTCDLVESYLEQIGGIDYCLKVNDGSTALHLLAAEHFDAVFLDLQLPGIDGVSLLKALPRETAVVIVSASADFGAESYQFDVIDYLIKPLEFSRFAKAVLKLKNRSSNEPAVPEEEALFLKDNATIHRIDLAKLLYVESQGNYAAFIFEDDKPVMTLVTLSKLNTLLPPHFVRNHRSYIVNLHAIRQIEGNHLVLRTNRKLPIGKSYRQELHEKLKIVN